MGEAGDGVGGWEVGPGEAVEDGLMQGGRGFQQDRQSNSAQQMRVQCYFVPDRCVPERKARMMRPLTETSVHWTRRPMDETSHGRGVPHPIYPLQGVGGVLKYLH